MTPTPRTDAEEHEGLLRGNAIPTKVVRADFAHQLEREIAELMNLLHSINSALDDCLMVPANVLPAWNAIRETLAKSEGVKP